MDGWDGMGWDGVGCGGVGWDGQTDGWMDGWMDNPTTSAIKENFLLLTCFSMKSVFSALGIFFVRAGMADCSQVENSCTHSQSHQPFLTAVFHYLSWDSYPRNLSLRKLICYLNDGYWSCFPS